MSFYLHFPCAHSVLTTSIHVLPPSIFKVSARALNISIHSLHVCLHHSQVFSLQARRYGIDRVAEEVGSSGSMGVIRYVANIRCDLANQAKSSSLSGLWAYAVTHVGVWILRDRQSKVSDLYPSVFPLLCVRYHHC